MLASRSSTFLLSSSVSTPRSTSTSLLPRPLVEAAPVVSGGRRPPLPTRAVTTTPLRTTRSKSFVKRNDSWVTGVGHDGMTFRARVLSTTLVYPARFRLVEGLQEQHVAYLPKNFKLPSSVLPYCRDLCYSISRTYQLLFSCMLCNTGQTLSILESIYVPCILRPAF